MGHQQGHHLQLLSSLNHFWAREALDSIAIGLECPRSHLPKSIVISAKRIGRDGDQGFLCFPWVRTGLETVCELLTA